MEIVQLFLKITNQDLNHEWNIQISEALKALPSAEGVQIIGQNQGSTAEVTISYEIEQLLIDDIEKVVQNCGADITDIIIHFPSGITGVADPYSASAVSIPIEESLKNIEGVLGGAISESGKLKVVFDPSCKNKQAALNEILKTYSFIKSHNT